MGQPDAGEPLAKQSACPLLGALILFVAEPLVLRRQFRDREAVPCDATHAWLYRGHLVLLALGVITISGAVAGAYG